LQTGFHRNVKGALAVWNKRENLMVKKAQKGNGGDKAGKAKAAETKKQLDFLAEVKELAKKHGVSVGGAPGAADAAMPGKRDLRVQVREQAGQIVVDFGQSISWMAMAPEQATKFAASVIKIVQNIQSIKASGGEALSSDDEAEESAEEKSEVDKPK